MALTPDINAYGTYARESALADLLELFALSGKSLTEAELADYIVNQNWIRMIGKTFHLPEEGEAGSGEEYDAGTEYAKLVGTLIDERMSLLGSRYPFLWDGPRLRYRGELDYHSPYLVLLAVTLAHAYKIELPFDAWAYFEEFVARSLQRKGLHATNLAEIRRGSANLAESLLKVGPLCRLNPTPDAGVYRTRAQEEGVDVIAHLDWDDMRPIHWVFLVQATCGKSDTWKRKMSEGSEATWQDLLGLLVAPKGMLAVPHHVPSDTIRYLTSETEQRRLLLDRIRLTVSDIDFGEREEQLLDALRNEAGQSREEAA